MSSAERRKGRQGREGVLGWIIASRVTEERASPVASNGPVTRGEVCKLEWRSAEPMKKRKLTAKPLFSREGLNDHENH